MSELESIAELMPEPRAKRGRRLTPDDAVLTDAEELILELVHVGVGLRKAESLVDRYPAKQIGQQLEWLSLRAPRRPASLLIAAIENNYEPPVYASK